MRNSLSQTLVLLLDSNRLLSDFLLFSASFLDLAVKFLTFVRETFELCLKLCPVSLLLLNCLRAFFQLLLPLGNQSLHSLDFRLKEVLLVQLLLLIFADLVLFFILKFGDS